MKPAKLSLLAATAMALLSASAANATVLISGLLNWKAGTATQSLSAPAKTLAFSFQASSPAAPVLSTFQAKLDGTDVAVLPTSITFNATGFVLSFAAPYTLNVTTNADWTGGFPATPWVIGSATLQVDGAGPASDAQISVLGIPSVPEPATWALMLGGFGLAGVSLRNRAAKQKVGYTA